MKEHRQTTNRNIQINKEMQHFPPLKNKIRKSTLNQKKSSNAPKNQITNIMYLFPDQITGFNALSNKITIL